METLVRCWVRHVRPFVSVVNVVSIVAGCCALTGALPAAARPASAAVNDGGGIQPTGPREPSRGGRPFPLGSSYRREWTRDIDLADAPPILDGDRLFALSRQGVLYALDPRDGADRWRVMLAHYLRPQFFNPEPARQPLRPASLIIRTPTVVGKYLLASVSDPRQGHLFAIDRDTGTVAWHYVSRRNGGATRGAVISSPSVDKDLVVFRTGGGLTALRVSDGTELWNVPLGPLESTVANTCSKPVLADGVAYLGADLGVAYAFRLSDGRKEWQYRTGAMSQTKTGLIARTNITPSMCTPVLADGFLIVATGTGYVYALHEKTGLPAWENKIGEAGQLVRAGDRLYAATATGFHEIDPHTGKTTHSLPLEGGAFSCVIGSSHALILRNPNVLAGWEVLDLSTWRNVPHPANFLITMGVSTDSSLIVAGGRGVDISPQGQRQLSAYSVAAPESTSEKKR